jgi:hypothetical protein
MQLRVVRFESVQFRQIELCKGNRTDGRTVSRNGVHNINCTTATNYVDEIHICRYLSLNTFRRIHGAIDTNRLSIHSAYKIVSPRNNKM